MPAAYSTYPIKEVAPPERGRVDLSKDGPLWLLTLDQIEKETGFLSRKTWISPDEIPVSSHAFDTRHVLYSKLRPNLNKVVCPDQPGIATSELVRLRPDQSRLDRKYLTYFLRSEHFMPFARQTVAGAKMPRMLMDKFWQFLIPVPGLSTQYQIVYILDRSDELRRRRRQSNRISSRILSAHFHQMFGDPNHNQQNWPALNFSEAFADLSRLGKKVPRSGYLTKGNYKVIDQGQHEIAGYWNDSEDVFRGELPVILFGDHTRVFKLLEERFCIGAEGVRILKPLQMDARFAFFMLTLMNVPSRGYSRHFKELKTLEYIRPPMELQVQFGEHFSHLQRVCRLSSATSSLFETLFQTLLARAFDGRLVTGTPAESRKTQDEMKEILQELEIQAKP